MIACIAKNDRARPLFAALSRLHPSYRDLGVLSLNRWTLIRAALRHPRLDLERTKSDARSSETATAALTRAATVALRGTGETPAAILQWGATNSPGAGNETADVPYFIVTDGPFDPNDATYPREWIPGAWPAGYFKMQHRLFRGARSVFALSDWAKRKLIDVHGLDREAVTVIGWGPMACIGGPDVAPSGGSGFFVSVGNEWRRKGMDVVAAAGAIVAGRRPGVRTLIIGNPAGHDLPARQGVVTVPIALPSEIVQPLLRQAQALVLASRFDASPHVLFEALQYGTPVVATRTCGIPEALREPLGGFVVEVGDAGGVADAMERVIDAGAALRVTSRRVYDKTGGWAGCAERVHARIIAELGSILG